MPSFFHFLPDHRQGSQYQTQKAKTRGHFILRQKKIDELAEKQNAQDHTCHQRQQKTDIFPKVPKQVTQAVQRFAIKSKNNQQHTAAKPRGNTAESHNDTFPKPIHTAPSPPRPQIILN